MTSEKLKDVHVRITEKNHKEARVLAAAIGCSVAKLFEVAYLEHPFHIGTRGVLDILAERDNQTKVQIEGTEFFLSELVEKISVQLPQRQVIRIDSKIDLKGID
mgnify:FL=1